MDEPVRWVSKAEAAQELEVSLSTLDRRIRKGEFEVVREGRRVYVRMHGPEYLSDDELLRCAIMPPLTMCNFQSYDCPHLSGLPTGVLSTFVVTTVQ